MFKRFLPPCLLAIGLTSHAIAQCPIDAEAIPIVSAANVPQSMDVNGTPFLGNSIFEISVGNPTGACGVTSGGSAILLALARAFPAPVPAPFGSCAGGADLLIPAQLGISVGPIGGAGVLPLPIPSDAVFCGFRFSVQAVFLDPGGLILLGNGYDFICGTEVT